MDVKYKLGEKIIVGLSLEDLKFFERGGFLVDLQGANKEIRLFALSIQGRRGGISFRSEFGFQMSSICQLPRSDAKQIRSGFAVVVGEGLITYRLKE